MTKIISFILSIAFIISCNNTTSRVLQVSANDIRIISLVPSVTKDLISLDMEKNIVGVTSFCDISTNNKNLIVGSVVDVNVEKILLLKPSIVFASDLTKQEDIETLKSNGINIHIIIGKVHSYKEICDNLLELGKLVDRTDLARSIISKSQYKIDSVRGTIPKPIDSLNILIQIGSKPIFAVIPNTFMDDYITFAGCKNILNDLEHGTVTRESIINRNPDVIFITTMGIVGKNEKETWESYSELKATRDDKIFILESKMANSPSVISFTETIEQIINSIYPTSH